MLTQVEQRRSQHIQRDLEARISALIVQHRVALDAFSAALKDSEEQVLRG
jgi:Tfp pilus assembly protein PilX